MKLQLSTILLAALVSLSSAAAFTPSHSTRDLSVLATVNERKHQKTLPTQRFSSSESTVTTETEPQDAKTFEVYELPATQQKTKPLIDVSLPAVASIFVATFATFLLNNHGALGPIKASSIAGLLSTLILPEKLALAAFCGSFAGMAKLAVIPGLAGGAALGVTCAVMLTLFDHNKWLIGVGGRLGFIAQCACTAQFLITSLIVTPTPPAALIGSTPLDFKALATQLPKVAGFTVVGALFMRLWKQAFADKSKRLANSVGAVSATGLLAAYALPASMAGPIFCGSFVAMAAPTKLANTKALVVASLLAGAAQQSLAGVMLGGWGGKLGTAALMGVLGYNLLEKLTPDNTLPEPQMNNNPQ